MSWASRRRSAYLGVVIVIALIVIAPIVFSIFNKEPTCFDGKQNRQEKGVDCGGICEKLCAIQMLAPVILWSRSFKISDGIYNSVAYVKNPNINAGILKIPYTFKLFDNKNILIAQRRGSTFISPNTVTPVFEGTIITGERIPTKTFFEFNQTFNWTQVKYRGNDLSVSRIKLLGTDSSPRVNAVISNNTLLDMFDIEVIALLFDKADNIITVSSTYIETFPNKSSRDIVFTWSDAFDSPIARIEIIPKIPSEN